MNRWSFSRRQFARNVGAALGAAIVADQLTLPAAEARRPKGMAENAILLNSNENPYGPSRKALEAMDKASGVAARYPDAVQTEMVEAIAAMHKVVPDQVMLGCGSGEILRVADMAFLGPGKHLVACSPSYEEIVGYAPDSSDKPVQIPLTADFRHNLPAMAAACNERTGLVYVCNPNNPTGTIVTRRELEDFLPRVPKTATVLVDEAYFHFVEDPAYSSAVEWVNRWPNLVVARTFSKIYGMAGMRLGYAVSTKENIRAMWRHRLWNNVNAAVLAAALVSLNDSAHVERQRRLNNDTRDWTCRELAKEGRRYIPSHANFFMVDVGREVPPVIQAFRERNVLVGRRFPGLDNWLRVSVGTRKEMQAFLAALREIVPVPKAVAA